MDNVTWVGTVAVVILVMQILSLYNSAHTAKRNHDAPMDEIKSRITNVEDHLKGIDYGMNELKKDVDAAHEHIRRNENIVATNTKAQNKALLVILLWIKDPQHGDTKQIDDAIQTISMYKEA